MAQSGTYTTIAGVTVQSATTGALSGDGSALNKLAVQVDGLTIDVNPSNQLEVIQGAEAPADAAYILQQADSDLANAQDLSALATGLMKVTTTTGAVTSVAGITTTITSATLVGKTITVTDGAITGFA